MIYEACIKFAPVFTLERLNAGVRPGRTQYDRACFRFLPGRSPVPLLVNHDDGREIGFVHDLVEWQNTDGPWHVARATVTHPPSWLKRGSKVSFGFSALHRSTTMHELHGVEVVRHALVNEVSVLVGAKPAEPLAHVALLQEARRRRAVPPIAPPLARLFTTGQADTRPRPVCGLKRLETAATSFASAPARFSGCADAVAVAFFHHGGGSDPCPGISLPDSLS